MSQSSNTQSSNTSSRGNRASVRTFVADIIELGELQAMLVAADAKNASSSVKFGLMLLVIGSVGTLAALTLLLFGAATAVQEQFEWSAAASQLLTAIVAVVTLGLLSFAGVNQLTKALAEFRNSTCELSNNLGAVKSALKRGVGRSDERRYYETLRDNA